MGDHAFVPMHASYDACAQIRLCPHTFVPRHITAHTVNFRGRISNTGAHWGQN